MSYLVDTHVLSELKRRQPDAQVLAWFSARPSSILYLSVLTLGEIRKGIERLADPTRQALLADWLESDLPSFFAGRIVPVDSRVADRWGRLQGTAPRPLPA